MNKCQNTTLLLDMLREQLYCIGRIVARHQVPDDVVWEIAKGFNVIFQRVRRQAEDTTWEPDPPSPAYRMVPHPAITYFLERLDREADTSASEVRKE